MSSLREVPAALAASERATKKQRVGGRSTSEDELEYGPMVDDATARKKLEEAGFNPDDVKQGNSDIDMDVVWRYHSMTYFAREGDLNMCRYLLSKGASTTERDPMGLWFPMYAAANNGHLDICKWLFKNGAARDIRGRNSSLHTPLEASRTSHEMTIWMILNGALSYENDPGRIDNRLVKELIERRRMFDNWVGSTILSWSKKMEENHRIFQEFLKGTLSPPKFSKSSLRGMLSDGLKSEGAANMILDKIQHDEHEELWEELILTRRRSPLRVFCGKQGMMENIADFVGVLRGKDLRIVRQLVGKITVLLEAEEEKARRWWQKMRK